MGQRDAIDPFHAHGLFLSDSVPMTVGAIHGHAFMTVM